MRKQQFKQTVPYLGMYNTQFFPTKIYSKTCVKWPLSKDQKMFFKTHYLLMQVKTIVLQNASAILSTFIKLPIVFKTFVLSIFECPFYTGFTVVRKCLAGYTWEFFFPILEGLMED